MNPEQTMNKEKELRDLMTRVSLLENMLMLLESQQIKIVDDFDGTNVQVSINGVRRKIATTSP